MNIIVKLIFAFFAVVSADLFAADTAPICGDSYTWICNEPAVMRAYCDMQVGEKTFQLGPQCPGSSGYNSAVCKWDCSCPAGQHLNTTFDGDGKSHTMCTDDSPAQNGSSSAASSSADACPSGQFRDGRGKCNTKCAAPTVYNVMADTCESPADCVYPQLYNALSNACADNPENCAQGAHRNVITGQCESYGETSCPSGYSCADASCLTCNASGGANSSSGNDSGSGSSSGAGTSSGSNSSTAPPPKPPVEDTDNADPGQSTSGSKPIPAGLPQSTCLTQNSATVCRDYENCQLTFGVGKCVGMSSDQNCPNQYVLNGQKYCVLQATNNSNSSSGGAGGSSGSAGSASSAGECDPTKKSYDECMGRNKTPSATETSKIKTDFDSAANKAIDDHIKAAKDDVEAFTRDGIQFKSATDSFKNTVLSLFPTSQPCSPYEMEFPFIGKVVLGCEYFEMWKRLFGWFLSIATAIYIYRLAMQPVER